MSGHFIVWSISQAHIDACIRNYANSAWGVTQHTAIGWDAASRLVLQNVKNNIDIGNRAGLPPHRYLEFPGSEPIAAQKQFLFSNDALWTLELVRPTGGGLLLTGLCPAAQTEWAAGKKRDALMAQITHGGTSIEVYYLGKNEIV